jgi:phosphoserine phosphatase RsbX
MGTLESGQQSRLPLLLDYAMAGRALRGQVVSGDAGLVQPFPAGALIAVIDGLGHGPEAAAASRAAVAILEEAETDAPVTALLERCHQAMLRTRGSALSLAMLHAGDNTMAWSGIGNVDAVLLRRPGGTVREDIALLNRGGVVGYRMPAPRMAVVPIFPGDLVVFATDGISSRFVEAVDRNAPTDEIAATVLERYGKATDDALVLVARWLGAQTLAEPGALA